MLYKSVLAAAMVIASLGASAESAWGVESISKENMQFPNAEFIVKGGVGVVNKSISIIVDADHNEISIKNSEGIKSKWIGEDAKKREIAIIVNEEVTKLSAPGADFDLRKAVIISFEENYIRFCDFQTMKGGSFARLAKRNQKIISPP